MEEITRRETLRKGLDHLPLRKTSSKACSSFWSNTGQGGKPCRRTGLPPESAGLVEAGEAAAVMAAPAAAVAVRKARRVTCWLYICDLLVVRAYYVQFVRSRLR